MIMVIHDESGLLEFPPVIKKPLFEPNSHVIPNNLGQDYENANENDLPLRKFKKLRKLSGNESDEKVRIKKKSKETDPSAYPSENDSSSDQISAEDLEELRTVYKNCKSVIRKIERKYGHLLDLKEPEQKRRRKNTRNTTDEWSVDDEKTECQCTLNKKIVFDDDGKEIAVDTGPSDHICPKKRRYQSQTSQTNDLQIEYYHQHIELPDSLQELRTILQNPAIDLIYRNEVIQKVREVKQEFANEIKFNKRSIVEKIKANMDEVIDFKGTNLSSLLGYVY